MLAVSYPYDKMCHFAALITLRRRRTYTSLETWKSTICSIFERTFLLKNLPITHVRQATIFAGQTVKFYRSVTDDRHLFRGLESTDCRGVFEMEILRVNFVHFFSLVYTGKVSVLTASQFRSFKHFLQIFQNLRITHAKFPL